MNSYNIYNEEDERNHIISYHAIAESEEQVLQLACQHDIDITGYTIELVRRNVKDERHRDYEPSIRMCRP